MTRFQSLLRDCARHSIDAAIWFSRYERSGNPEHRRNALLELMDARDCLKRAETAVTQAMDEPATKSGVG